MKRVPALRGKAEEIWSELTHWESKCNWSKVALLRCELAAIEAELHMLEEDF
jgi:hypothetical protein